jgi:cell division protein FtsQ
MHDLRIRKAKGIPRNRLKRQRRPINYRSFFKKSARVVGGIIALSLMGVVSFELYGILVRNTFLRLERIEVGTLKRLTRDEVIALAGVQTGDDMLALRLSRIGEQLAKNPWIETVKVRRYFPHTITIDIAEREPAAVVNMGYLYYLDEKGEIFKPLTEGDRLDYPVLTGFAEEDMARDPNGFREGLQRALELIALLKKEAALPLGDVSEIHYDKGFGFTIFTAQGGVPVRLGNGAFGDKLARLARIYGDLQAQLPRLEYIDLDYTDKIIVKKA